MIKISIFFIAILVLAGCSKESAPLLPEGDTAERIFYAEYTQTYKGNTSLARHVVGLTNDDKESLQDTLSIPILHVYTNYYATSTIEQEGDFCTLTTTLREPIYTGNDSYLGIGFQYHFPLYNCPLSITKELTDTLFERNKEFSIGTEIGQIEISKNRNRGHTLEDTSELAAGVSLATDNEENVVKIISVNEYSWIRSGYNTEEIINGKLIEIEFNAKLQRTYWGDFTYPAEYLELKNGKGIFYIEYTN